MSIHLLRVCACFGSLWIMGASSLQAQALPAQRGTALERLRTLVGVPVDGTVAPSQPKPGRLRLIPATTPVRQAPARATEGGGVPTPTSQLERLLERLPTLVPPTASVPVPAALVPVAHPLPFLETPTSGESVPPGFVVPLAHATPVEFRATGEVAEPNTAGSPTASPEAPYRFSLWESVGVLVCLALLGTFVLSLLVVISRWSGLKINFVLSLGSPAPRA